MMKYNTQIVAVLLAGLVLVSGVGPISGVGIAAAQEVENTSTSADERKCSEVGIFRANNPDCQSHYGSGYVKTTGNGKETVYVGVDTGGRTAEQVQFDLFADGILMADATRQHTRETRSHNNQTVALAYSEAWNAAVQVRNNGGSKSQATQASYNAVNEFYSMQQRSLYIQQNRQSLRLQVMVQTLNETDGLQTDQVLLVPEYDAGYFEFVQHNVQLWNGESMNVTTGKYWNEDTGSGYVDEQGWHCYAPYGPSTGCSPDEDNTAIADWLQITSPTGETITIMDGNEYNKSYHQINDNRQQALDNMDVVVDGIWSNCDVGECKPSDAGPIHLIYSMSSDYDSTGHYAPASALLGAQGYAGNVSMAYTVTWDNAGPNGNVSAGPPEKTADGQMWWTPGAFQNDTVQSGVEYNASEQNGSVYFIYQDGSLSRDTTFNGTYTPDEIRNTKTNEVVNTTSGQDTTFDTTDTEDLNARLSELLAQMAALEDEVDSGEGSGDGGGGIPLGESTTRLMIVAIILIAGAALLAGREDDYRR